jgi:hypothetical protein
MNVRRRPNRRQKAELVVRAKTRSHMGGYQDTPQCLVPLDKATLLGWAILWASDSN